MIKLTEEIWCQNARRGAAGGRAVQLPHLFGLVNVHVYCLFTARVHSEPRRARMYSSSVLQYEYLVFQENPLSVFQENPSATFRMEIQSLNDYLQS